MFKFPYLKFSYRLYSSTVFSFVSLLPLFIPLRSRLDSDPGIGINVEEIAISRRTLITFVRSEFCSLESTSIVGLDTPESFISCLINSLFSSSLISLKYYEAGLFKTKFEFDSCCKVFILDALLPKLPD